MNFSKGYVFDLGGGKEAEKKGADSLLNVPSPRHLPPPLKPTTSFGNRNEYVAKPFKKVFRNRLDYQTSVPVLVPDKVEPPLWYKEDRMPSPHSVNLTPPPTPLQRFFEGINENAEKPKPVKQMFGGGTEPVVAVQSVPAPAPKPIVPPLLFNDGSKPDKPMWGYNETKFRNMIDGIGKFKFRSKESNMLLPYYEIKLECQTPRFKFDTIVIGDDKDTLALARENAFWKATTVLHKNFAQELRARRFAIVPNTAATATASVPNVSAASSGTVLPVQQNQTKQEQQDEGKAKATSVFGSCDLEDLMMEIDLI